MRSFTSRRNEEFLVLFFLFMWSSSSTSFLTKEDTVYYTLSYNATLNPTTIFVTLSVLPAFNATLPVVISIPRGVPSDYSEVLYDSFVQNITAFDSQNQPLSISKDPNGPRWVLSSSTSSSSSSSSSFTSASSSSSASSFSSSSSSDSSSSTSASPVFSTFSYTIDLTEQEQGVLSGTDSSKIRPGSFLGIYGVSVFAYLFDFINNPTQVIFSAVGPQQQDTWKVFSTLTGNGTNSSDSSTLIANTNDYYLLQDSQFGSGPNMNVLTLPIEETQDDFNLHLMLYSEGPVDVEMMSELAQLATSSTLKWFGNGKPLPFPEFTIWVELVQPIDTEHQYGFGLEHLQSAHFCLTTNSTILANTTQSNLEKMAYLFAHHVSHAWVPKRCYGEYYYPFQFEIAPVMDMIWFNEGWAQYIAILAIAPYLPNSTEYFQTELYNRFVSSLEEVPSYMTNMPLGYLSQIGSTQYSLDFRTGETLFSRGGLMAYNVDLQIQSESANRYSIRDVILELVSLVEKTQQPINLETILKITKELTSVDIRKTVEQWMKGWPQGFPNYLH